MLGECIVTKFDASAILTSQVTDCEILVIGKAISFFHLLLSYSIMPEI